MGDVRGTILWVYVGAYIYASLICIHIHIDKPAPTRIYIIAARYAHLPTENCMVSEMQSLKEKENLNKLLNFARELNEIVKTKKNKKKTKQTNTLIFTS